LMEGWFANVMRYSRRDQLSLPLALNAAPAGAVHVSPLDLRVSRFHKWPIEGYARPSRYFEIEPVGAHRPGGDTWLDDPERAWLRGLIRERSAAVRRSEQLQAELDAIKGGRIWRWSAGLRWLRDQLPDRRPAATDRLPSVSPGVKAVGPLSTAVVTDTKPLETHPPPWLGQSPRRTVRVRS
jgi:hypothetical protein